MATVDDFLTLDLRVGTVVAAEVLRGARKPSFSLQVDFGALGRRRSSAQISDLYEPSELRAWVEPIRRLAEKAERVQAIFNNCVRNYAVLGAKDLAVLLSPEQA